MIITRKNPKLGNYLHYLHQAEARDGGKEQILIGYQQIQVGADGETGEPIIADGAPIYEDGDDLFEADWNEAWGVPPTDEDLEAWEEPEPEPNPVTDVNSPIPAILQGYVDSESERSNRINLLKAAASYALGAKIAGEMASANPPTNADELAAIKAAAKTEASRLGGIFFDIYFGQIGSYREGGGPKFLTDVQADSVTEFLDWPLPANGITLPNGVVILPNGGIVEDLFVHFLT